MWIRLCVESLRQPLECNEWKRLFCLLAYKYKLLNTVFLILWYIYFFYYLFIFFKCKKAQIVNLLGFFFFFCCSKAIQVYLKKEVLLWILCRWMHWSALMFILCLIPFTLCCQCLFILHEVRVPSRSLPTGCGKFPKWRVQKLGKCNCWSLFLVCIEED